MAAISIDATLSGGSTLAAPLAAHWVESANLQGSSSLSAQAAVKLTARSTLLGLSTLASSITVDLGIQSPIRYQPGSRRVDAGKLVLEQVDLFLANGKTRAQNIVIGDLNLKLFFNNSQIEWPLVSGANVQDLQVTAGQIYWTEFLTGFYTIRFFPNVVGSWRILLTYPAYDQAVSLSYDVVQPMAQPMSLGLHTSFVRK